jgi:hypothetical protein
MGDPRDLNQFFHNILIELTLGAKIGTHLFIDNKLIK